MNVLLEPTAILVDSLSSATQKPWHAEAGLRTQDTQHVQNAHNVQVCRLQKSDLCPVAPYRVYHTITGQPVLQNRQPHFPGSQPVSLARSNLGLLQHKRWVQSRRG